MSEEVPVQAVVDARRHFDEACARLRPDLHRFCTRMTGSPCDGEDVLQEVLIRAFYSLHELRDGGSLRSWLFRIAHNKCIDFMRGHRRFVALDELRVEEDEPAMDDTLDRKQRAEQALANVVVELPPRERACLILKDILDCSLEETAAITGANVGAVKAALHRGRAKLEQGQATARPIEKLEPSHRALAERYIAAFNQRDWVGVRTLLAAGARLNVVERSDGPFSDSSYFINYGRLSWTWKLELAAVDGVETIVNYRCVESGWVPHAIVQLGFERDEIALVRDYIHVDYLLRHCTVLTVPTSERDSNGA